MMKRAEQMAWGALAGLVVVFGLLVTGGFMYNFTAFWGASMLTGVQAIIVGLAAWGLMLARQAKELEELPSLPGKERGTSQFRMSAAEEDRGAAQRRGGSRTHAGLATGRLVGHIVGGHLGGAIGSAIGAAVASNTRPLEGAEPALETKTLDTSFQRLLVGLCGVMLLGFGCLTGYLLYSYYNWAHKNPETKFPIAGTLNNALANKPGGIDEIALLIGLSMALLYGILYWITRPRRSQRDAIDSEPVTSNFTLGVTPMAALAAGTTLGFFGVAWASEAAAGVIAFFMLLQGLELLVNACRSYSAIEEMDQDVIDLQATPLGPMLSSIWLAGLRMLFAQSVGLSGNRERGVIARMMPRALLAMLIIAIAASCFRVVPPGKVAVLEHLGAAPTVPIPEQPNMSRLSKDAILQPGLHFCWPWPIDNLVLIPNEQLQTTTVGTEVHNPKDWGKGVDFEFWTVRPNRQDDAKADSEDLFVTGDRAPQILETYVQVQWRVERPELFYSLLSHSDFADVNQKTQETKLVPIYEAIIKQCTSFAVTRTFAIHELQQVMVMDRREVEEHCKDILQTKLNSLGKAVGLEGSGITVDFLTIKDLHPPYWRADRASQGEMPLGGQIVLTEKGIQIQETGRSRLQRGPASAFENVVSMAEFKEALIAYAQGARTQQVLKAKGDADAEKLSAQAYSYDRIARAHGDADRLLKMTENLNVKEQGYQIRLMEQRLFYSTLSELLDPVNKVITDPEVREVQIWQATDKGVVPMVPQGR
ncbi:MAG TPA: SPFH domain-containing protein [Phycisphaerae bacterium]|nr:SPFH domain-containing protein [Phycisphaerae bacterium]